MRKTLAAVTAVILGLAAATTSSPVRAEFISGNTLYRYCTGTDSDYSQVSQRIICTTYIQGAHDGLEAGGRYVTFKIDSKDDPIQIVCVPSGVETGQLQDLVVAHLRDNPAVRDLSASVLVLAAIAKAYPCRGL